MNRFAPVLASVALAAGCWLLFTPPEAFAQSAVPPEAAVDALKSAEQRQQDRDRCESARKVADEEIRTIYKARMGVCAAQHKSALGHFSEEMKQFAFEHARLGSGDCATQMNRQYAELTSINDRRRDACLKAADHR